MMPVQNDRLGHKGFLLLLCLKILYRITHPVCSSIPLPVKSTHRALRIVEFMENTACRIATDTA
jgi:hypothetical protein